MPGFSGPEANQDGDRLFLGRQLGRSYWEEINRSSKSNFLHRCKNRCEYVMNLRFGGQMTT